MTLVAYDGKIERSGSSAISAIYYDAQESRLYIEFVKQGFAGSIAGYSGVPEDIFNKFARAESIGKFYNRVFLGYGFDGYDMPGAPEMTHRDDMPKPVMSTSQDDEWEESYTGDPNVYVVMVTVAVPGCDSPGEAINEVLRSIKYNTDYTTLGATVKPNE